MAIGGDNLPSLVRIGLTDLPNIGGASGPPGPPGSGITVFYSGYWNSVQNFGKKSEKRYNLTILIGFNLTITINRVQGVLRF